MRDGGGRLASLIGALMQSGVRVRSPPGIWRRWRQVWHAAVRRRVVPLLHRARSHRSNPHAPAPVVATVHSVVLHVFQIAEHRLQKYAQTLIEDYNWHRGDARQRAKIIT